MCVFNSGSAVAGLHEVDLYTKFSSFSGTFSKIRISQTLLWEMVFQIYAVLVFYYGEGKAEGVKGSC